MSELGQKQVQARVRGIVGKLAAVHNEVDPNLERKRMTSTLMCFVRQSALGARMRSSRIALSETSLFAPPLPTTVISVVSVMFRGRLALSNAPSCCGVVACAATLFWLVATLALEVKTHLL